MEKRILSLILALAMLVSLLPARIVTADAVETTEEYTYDVSLNRAPENWSPMYSNDESFVCNYTQTPLVDISIKDSSTGEFQWIYLAAQSVTDVTSQVSNAAGSVYEIVLNPALCWEDGTAINADSYIYSMQQMLDPQMQYPNAGIYYDTKVAMVGAYEYCFGGSLIFEANDTTGVIEQESDMTLGEDGNYRDADGNPMYIGLNTPLPNWLGGSLKDYVDSYGDAYFDVDAYGQLEAMADEEYFVVLNPETLQLLRDVISTPNWGESEADFIHYVGIRKEMPVMEWDTVGLKKVDEYTIRYFCEDFCSLFDFLSYACSLNWLVHQEMYESCKEDGTYCTNAATTMSYGPYRLEVTTAEKLVLVRNEKHFEYTADSNGKLSSVTSFQVDGDYVPQWQMDSIVAHVIPGEADVEQSFLSGVLDEWLLPYSAVGRFLQSPALYRQPGGTTYSIFMNINPDDLLEMDANYGCRNSIVMSNDSFRKAFSMSLDRAGLDLGNATRVPAVALMGPQYYYDAENNPNSLYRNSEYAMEEICNLYGVAYGPGTACPTLKEAYESITGYDPEQARTLMAQACRELVDAGLYSEGEPIALSYAVSSITEGTLAIMNSFSSALNAAAQGSGFGNITVFAREGGFNWANDMREGNTAMVLGGWTGSSLDPFSFMDVYLNPMFNYVPHSLDTSEELLTLNVGGRDYTLTWADWPFALSNIWEEGGAEALYRNVEALAKLERAYLEQYFTIPMVLDSTNYLVSHQVDYYTDKSSSMYGFGGTRLMRFNYTDAQWEEMVAAGNLDYGETAPAPDDLVIWGQTSDIPWMEARIAEYMEEHPELEMKIVAEACDDIFQLVNYPHTAPDAFYMANDTLESLLRNGIIAPLQDETVAQFADDIGSALIDTVTGMDGEVYGIPYTSNTWFMYYNKRIFTEDDVKSLEAMLEKGKVAFPVANSWYLPAFYFAAGGSMFGPKGNDSAAGVQFGGENGTAATNYLVDLVSHENFINDVGGMGNEGLQNGTIGAYFSGSWDYVSLYAALGDDLGAVQLPTIQLNGEARQLMAYCGSLAYAINPNSAYRDVAEDLILFLTNEESQLHRCLNQRLAPTITALADLPEVQAMADVAGQMLSAAYSALPQPYVPEMNIVWGAMTDMGNELVAGNITHENASEKTDLLNAALNGRILVASGTCGEALKWELAENQTLYIFGEGDMYDYEPGAAPWYGDSYRINNVVVAEGVTSIGDYAFYGLENVGMTPMRARVAVQEGNGFHLPEGLLTIGDGAFRYTTVTDLYIPASVTEIGKEVADNNGFLQGIWVDEENAVYSSDESGVLLNKEQTTLIYAHEGLSGEYEIPATVTEISDEAFAGCELLTAVAIPEGMETVGESAFANCSSLQEIAFRGDAPEIADTAFDSVEATVKYPVDNESWTEDTLEDFGGTVTWTPYVPPCEVHSYESVTTAPSCTEQGYTSYTCTVCGDSYQEIFAEALGHNFVDGICTNCGADGIASGVCGENLTWSLSSDGVLTISGQGDTYGYEFGDTPWFEIRESITSLVLEDGVTGIGQCVFYNLYNLTDVTIPDSVTTIDYGAFDGCSSLRSITIPESVTSIGNDVFWNCESLTGIWVSEDNQHYSSDDLGALFNKDKTELLRVPGALEGTYSIPNGVTTIGPSALANCRNLSSVIIPDSVTFIGGDAFFQCSSLQDVTIPAGVTVISGIVFGNCQNLTAIHVSEENQVYSSDDRGVLFNKDKTELIQAPGALEGTYAVPDGVGTIQYNAFSNCGRLTDVTIPDSVINIHDCAFYDCYNLSSVTIGSGVTKIGYDAFRFCQSLSSVTIPDSVEVINGMAFSECYGLNSVTIGSNVSSIGDGAFFCCVGLNSITFRGNAPEFYGNAFESVTATAYYPGGAPSWTQEVMQDYGGTITWTAVGEVIGMEIVSLPEYGIVGQTPDLSGLRADLIYSNDMRVPLSAEDLTIGQIDTTTAGRKNVTVSYGEFTAEFVYGVHEGAAGVVLDPSFYPESEHEYGNDMDDTQTLTWPGATGLILVFSQDTWLEEYWDRIYVYDGNDNEIATYTGNEAAGITLEIPGDTVKIRLTSDGSVSYYGYSFSSISTMGSVVHTGAEGTPAVEATCTEPGRTAGILCEICGEDCFEVIPALGHDYEAVVTAPTPEENGYTTYTCSRCGDSYVGDITIFGQIAGGTSEDGLSWALSDEGVLTISGSGAMTDYYDEGYGINTPWWPYHDQILAVVIEEGVENIGSRAFELCENLENVTIASGVTSIGEYAFSNCTGLGSIVIPNSVTSIEEWAFHNCTSLEHVEIPNSISTIGYGVFRDCTALEHVDIPDSVSIIGNMAFYYCTSLRDVVIPESVGTIAGDAFSCCYNLNTITFLGEAPVFVEDVFVNIGVTAYYPANDPSWTEEVMQQYGGVVTWVGMGEFVAMELLYAPSMGIIGQEPKLTGLRAELVYANDLRIPLSNDMLLVGDIDTTTVGKKTVTVAYREYTAEFTYAVHEGEPGVVLDPSLYPESTHNYGEYLDDTQILTWPDARGLVLTFSEETKVETGFDQIYVYDGNDELIGNYTGNEAAGITLEVPGDTVKIRLTSDGSVTFYGYSFTSIATPDILNHTGTELEPAVEATCTEDGHTARICCDICGQEQYTVIPALGHDYESVVTDPTPEENGYTTHTCTRCGYSYVSDVTVFGAIANGTCGDDLTWSLGDDGTLTIFGSGNMYDYDIGDMGGNMPWCIYADQIHKVVIEEGVTSIGDYAFAFCAELKTIEISETVHTIGYCAFIHCNALKEILVADENEYFSVEDGILFNYERTELICYPAGKTGGYAIPESVAIVSAYAFSGAAELSQLTIPDSVWSLGAGAFSDCIGLTEIVIPTSVVSVGRKLFMGCTQLESVSLPDDFSMLPVQFFYGCSNLRNITLPEKLYDMEDQVFGECWSLTELVIPSSVEYLRARVFAGSGLERIIFTGNTPQIDDNAFESVTATAYYPANDSTWTEEVRQNYGGDITWAPIGDGCEEHSYEVVVTAPTCTEQGYTTYTCTVCGDSYTDSEVAAMGHLYGDWEIVTEATCTADGLKRQVCSNGCNMDITEVIPQTGHAMGEWYIYIGATCTTDGEDRSDCANCDYYESTETPAPGHNYVDGTCSECGEADPDAIQLCELKAIEVSMEAEVVLRLKTIIPDAVINNDNAYAVMNKAGVETIITMAELREAGKDKSGRYILEVGIASGEMTKIVTMSIYDGNGNLCNISDYISGIVGTSVSRTVLDYAELALTKGNAKQKAIVTALLTYGGYAQSFFNKDAANPAYDLLPELGYEIPDISGITADTITQELTKSDTQIGITQTAQQAYLESAVYHRVYYVLDAGYSIDDFTFVLTYTEGGVEKTMDVEAVYEASKNRYYIDILDIPAAYWDYMYKITATNVETGETYEVSTSVLAYLKLGLEKSTNEKQKNLFRAMYYYNQAANSFFGK